jgi:hypothetical protein
MRAELILERALLYAQCSMTARVKRIKIMKNEQINKFSILLKSDIGDADQYERGMCISWVMLFSGCSGIKFKKQCTKLRTHITIFPHASIIRTSPHKYSIIRRLVTLSRLESLHTIH